MVGEVLTYGNPSPPQDHSLEMLLLGVTITESSSSLRGYNHFGSPVGASLASGGFGSTVCSQYDRTNAADGFRRETGGLAFDDP